MRLATLFSGIGAPEQGAKRVYGDDIEMVFACEFDYFARKSFKANYKTNAGSFYINIDNNPMNLYRHIPFTISYSLTSKNIDSYTKKTLTLHLKKTVKFACFSTILDGTKYRDKVDILVGGSPCQAFSIAGLRNGTDDVRGQLIYQYVRVVDEVKSPIIIYENVKGMLSIDNGNTIKEFVQALRDIGYHCHYEVLNTKDYGIPQNRERIFLVGFLNYEQYHRFQFAPKVKLTKLLKDVFEDDVDEKYYLSDKLLSFFDRHEKKHEALGNTFKFEPHDENSIHSKCLTARYNKLGVSDPYIKVNGRIRKYTPLECLRLQDFPDTFIQVVSDSQMYKQVGNSMSVNVLEMIFKQIEKAKEGKEINNLFDFI